MTTETTNTWQIAARLRWRQKASTTTEPRILEQAHCCLETGETVWKPIPVENAS